jgi:hypothetical protein
MAIRGPNQLPVVFKADSEALKLHVLSQLGSPNVLVEIGEVQFEQALRSAADFIVRYFPLEEKYAFFNTQPLVAEYSMPEDAYWIRECAWDPSTTRIDDIFGAESFLFNIGNISGIQNILTDYHLLQSYRKFSQRILGTEGQWEYKVSTNTIRMFPIPRGTFPVVVQYIPIVTSFNSPQAREMTYQFILAKMKIALGHARRKVGSVPSPDGGQIQLDGDSLVQEGMQLEQETIQEAIRQGEPIRPYLW